MSCRPQPLDLISWSRQRVISICGEVKDAVQNDPHVFVQEEDLRVDVKGQLQWAFRACQCDLQSACVKFWWKHCSSEGEFYVGSPITASKTFTPSSQ